ncbi:hypothetical protein NADFUDRAFT_53879 [Nadsonia fulvescens var. elongata DSM 6958]|uniref:Zn(2)-C6 fungal-type domain-containing protein n=1 Tax=Nadsonia fulvescens var. elongata DSM 6958 TaxID=857566 RepID=A0A1E3PQL1_9ASCO|nr:hypothetical protein NADFUDRAFT_53879 [Nadsonia fulvescens var. elongata DSM 6958]
MDSDEKILKELTESSLKHKLPVESYPTTPRQPYNTSKVSKPKRKAHNKSRLGCQTCKRRRIKCDETRPICLKCQNLGLECGYEIEARAKTKQFPKENAVLISATETIPGSLPSSSNIPPPLEDGLAMIDLRLLHHYNTVVWKTITDAGISDEEIWREDLPVLALDNPFLMHALLCFSATHLSRTVKGIYDQAISFHRLQAMSMLREAVKSLKPENTDPLVASSLLLIMESLANASTHSAEARSASAQAWIFHVRGAATILSAVWPLTPESRFYRLIGMDLRDLNNSNVQFEIFHKVSTTGLDIFDPDIADLYPVDLTSPYFPALAYLDKLQSQQNFPDFILRVFSFPALMDKKMGELLCAADTTARRILGAYCKFVLKYTHQMKDKIWFLEGLASVPRADIEVFGSLGLVSLNLPQIGILDEMMPDYDFNTFDVMDYLV